MNSHTPQAQSGLSDPGRIRELLSRHGFHFSKALGQNFLINPGVCPRMAAECGAENCKGVIEVGPGIGVLTWELSQAADKVCAIELDRRLFPVLEETLSGCSNVKIIPGDVMKLDLAQLIQEEFEGGPVCVCANLPYYITSPGNSPAAGGAAACHLHYGDGPKGGGGAAVRGSRLQGVRGGERGGPLPGQAPDFVPGGAGELSAAAQGGLRGDPPGPAAGAAGAGGGRGLVFPGGSRGLCPAPENGGQFSFQRLRAGEGQD